MKRYLVGILLGASLLLAASGRGGGREELLVSAASSLTEAMNEIGAAFEKANPQATVRFNFAASGLLQQQIAQGAPVDVFASAAVKEMNALQKAGKIETATRSDFAGNRLALIVPPESRVKGWNDLRKARVRRVALSNPDSVPSGRYARETLMARRLWDAVQPKAVFGENVRQTLAYVANGDVDAGIVFATDARIAGRRARIAAVAISGKDHAPILYPAAVVQGAANAPSARRFVAFLRGREAQAILAKYGFAPPGDSARSGRERRAPAAPMKRP